MLPRSIQADFDTPVLLPLTLRTVGLALLTSLLVAVLIAIEALYTWVSGGARGLAVQLTGEGLCSCKSVGTH
jgi:hypothetical protein